MRVSLTGLLLAGACASSPVLPPPAFEPAPQQAERSAASQPKAPVATWEAEVALFQALNRERLARRLPPLRIDRGLSLIAQSTAGEYRRLGRGAEARVLTAADRDLQAFALTFERTLSAVAFAERVDDAVATLEAALDPAMRWVGIAVVQAPPPVGPRGGLGVVLTLGQ